MAKYKREQGLDTLEKEIEAEMAKGQPQPQVKEPEPADAEDASFKKSGMAISAGTHKI